MTSLQKAAFLDRDGVLNRCYAIEGKDGQPTTRPPRNFEEVELLPGAGIACDRLRAAGFDIVIVSNQPDVPRGIVTRDFADEVSRRIARFVGAAAYFTCYHHPDAGCGCRKPRPGLISAAAWVGDYDLSRSVLIGDRPTDAEAAERAGIPYRYKVRTNDSMDLLLAVDAIRGRLM